VVEEVEDLEDEVEDEEIEDDEDADELEELEEDEVEEVAPKSKSSAQTVTFGASDLAKYLTKTTGKKVDARGLRTLIRKMARDGSGRVKRDIVAGNRSRYDWSGVDDPEVKRIIKAFKAGELDADKKEKLDALKARKASKDKAAAVTTKKKKAKPAPVVEDDDDDELELDEDDE
jgi:hypothetical protein